MAQLHFPGRARPILAAGIGGAVLVSLVACGIGAKSETKKPPSTHAPEVAGAGPIRVVAAENFYGEIALVVGRAQVTVRSILTDPSADPHEYESSAKDSAAVADAQLLIKNGAGYDAFIDKLIGASPRPQRIVVNGSELARIGKGDNPHVWYRPDVPPLVASAIADALSRIDPAHADAFQANAKEFTATLEPLRKKADSIRAKYPGAPVLPTEQVANYLLIASGLQPAHGAFQRAIEDGNDPPAKSVQEFRQTLTERRTRLLVYNTQTTSKITDQMRKLAEDQRIPVVGVTETLPKGKSFAEWMIVTLEAVEAGLARSA
jgi:zinc/manganese transport system substrate-binding protein